QSFSSVPSVTNIEPMIGAQFIIKTSGECLGVIGLGKWLLQRPVEIKGFLRRRGRYDCCKLIKEHLPWVAEPLLLVGDKEERLVLLYRTAKGASPLLLRRRGNTFQRWHTYWHARVPVVLRRLYEVALSL